MGYRSEVGISLRETDFNTLVLKAKELSINDGYELLKCADKIVKTNNIVTIHFDWVKWYKDFASVSFIMHYLRDSADGYGFVEIGEDDTDITSEYEDSKDGQTFYEYVEIVREVYVQEGEELRLE